MSIPIDTGTSVTLHFSLALDDGYVVDSNFEGNAATFTVGDGNLLPGFETVLMGLVDGEERGFTISPEHAFGQHNPEMCRLLSVVILVTTSLRLVPCILSRTVMVSCPV